MIDLIDMLIIDPVGGLIGWFIQAINTDWALIAGTGWVGAEWCQLREDSQVFP